MARVMSTISRPQLPILVWGFLPQALTALLIQMSDSTLEEAVGTYRQVNGDLTESAPAFRYQVVKSGS